MDDRIEKTLAKLRKKATSALSKKALFDALETLGYTMEKGKKWRDVSNVGLRPKDIDRSGIPCLDNHNLRLHPHYSGKPAEFSLLSGGRGQIDERAGYGPVEDLHTFLLALKVDEPPVKVVVHEVLTIEISDVEIQRTVSVSDPDKYHPEGWWNLRRFFQWRGLVGYACTTITCPEGQSYVFYNQRSLHELSSWLFETTSLADRAAEMLGVLTVEEERQGREVKARDWTNTGTCPVCFRNIKMSNGRMVHHGYERPGWGYTVGSCEGVGYEPYERSTRGTEDYRAELRSKATRLQTQLDKLQADDFKGSFTRSRRSRGSGKKYFTLSPGDKGWEAARADAVSQTKSDLGMVECEIEFLTGRIEAWKPGMKMPEELAAQGKIPPWQRSG